MSPAVSPPIAPRARAAPVAALAFLAGSILIHAVALAIASRAPEASAPVAQTPIELVEVEVKPPPEPTPPPPEPKEPPKVRVAAVKRPAPPPDEKLPPPPNEETPEPPKEPPPLVVGVTMSSTTVAGDFAAPVGNTAYGKVENRAQDPSTIKPYSAPKYAPLSSVDQPPELVSEFKPPYPEEARRAGIEGRVTLQITIDDSGKVTSAKVIQGVGYGLDDAARDGMLKARFRPAIRGGQNVATLLTFVYRFELP